MINKCGTEVNVIDNFSQSVFVIISPYLSLSHDLKKHIYKNYFYKRILLCDHLFYTKLGIEWSEKQKLVYEYIKTEKIQWLDGREKYNRDVIQGIAYVFTMCGANVVYSVFRDEDENTISNEISKTYKFDGKLKIKEGQTSLIIESGGRLTVSNCLDLSIIIGEHIDLFIVDSRNDDLFQCRNKNIVKILY